MKSSAIVYTIRGPKDAVAKAASRLQTTHQLEGKVVRSYDLGKEPSPIETTPDDADVVIIRETAGS